MSLNDYSDDDNWETMEVPDLLVNSEASKKKLEERKQIEEADNLLTEDLFGSTTAINVKGTEKGTEKGTTKETNKQQSSNKQINSNQATNNKQQIKNKQKEKQQMQRQEKERKKAELERQRDLFGVSENDAYDELYGDIAENY